MAWSDEPWIVEGANVRVSIIGQDDGSETERYLDGERVAVIHADLTGGAMEAVDLPAAKRLHENAGVAFIADVKAGKFDISRDRAREMLSQPNHHGRPNTDVIFPWVNGMDVTRRTRDMFIVDFGLDMTEEVAARYEAPFEYVRTYVKPARDQTRRDSYRERWWRHAEPVSGMRRALAGLSRFIVTPTVAKYRLFVWKKIPTLPDHQLVAVAREDDYAFGVLHSRAHECWSLRLGTSLEDRPRYTPTSTFETFPFPWRLNSKDDELTQEEIESRDAIARAAHALDEARERWLNPPELVHEEADVVPELPPRLVPVSDEAARELGKRTLTNLYNARPTWLGNLHRDLDAAVFTAYKWPDDLTDEEMLGRLLALNRIRSLVEYV